MEIIVKYLGELITAFVAIMGIFFTYIQAKKPKYVQTIEETKSAVDIANQLYERLNDEVDRLTNRNKQMSTDLDNLRIKKKEQEKLMSEQIKTLRETNYKQQEEIAELKLDIKKLRDLQLKK